MKTYGQEALRIVRQVHNQCHGLVDVLKTSISLTHACIAMADHVHTVLGFWNLSNLMNLY